MSTTRPQRIFREFTPEERERWQKAKDEALAERPQMIEKLRRLQEANEEPTFSGALRKAIHRHPKLLPTLAAESGIPLDQLDEFLTGERNLRSDRIDRLIQVLGFKFPPESVPQDALKGAADDRGRSPPIIDPNSVTAPPYTV